MPYKYSEKKILILGIGLTGISCINFFLKKGAIPKIIDESEKPNYLNKVPKNIQYKLGGLEKKWILESDLIVISPGISSYKPILIEARMLGIEIISDIELFAREVESPIISITGTNGKSTVATMVKEIAKKSGYKTYLIGNIGFPVLNILSKKADLYILELSSFQLENIFSLKSKIAVVLNINEDHLDRYPKGFKQYKKIKLSIYKNTEICLVNLKEKNCFFKNKQKKYITFGTSNSNYCIKNIQGNNFLCHEKEKIINASKTLLYGYQNYENALVALAISDAMKFPRDVVKNVLKNFKNLPHRFQIVHKHNNISWINDSKSTNVSSTEIALKNISTQGTIWLLLGGDKKSADFNILKNYLEQLKIKIYCFGKDGINIAQIFQKKSIYVENLKDAIILISKQAKQNDVILLSPGCSSKDQFKNFEERGNLFIKLLKEIS
ncbi:UDP-N-acetylmuramoyl-L-alanine--D-glutamate ligase [Buchnera aphidicola]|uniref:UDP-N-acetylmuramoylalanine--D-glutamate ligase n=1 Tax=Buchnera aphidicola (Aphis gossypii) TaxID=98785 RepID=A0A5J6Z9S4_9GAMM|nr:UDP-N-acetylmuramoyl-L-alanine--D-glutamate ligase [Buchnera aphidicola]QFQ32060.1 UDP-N-acetylmuramoyl-L-alanine--D-glutamate ligase [Buchnera aphidicola (Aphis gossypii)]UPT14587.1 UDP-N-acetylmuramoyl-L-alanine--D-glutamate ligase [Buchnera aphidicola (Aphis gossypii)]